ncbi:MAG: hypothetical protein ABSF53_21310 [Terracidiphilus sp.]|jgi:hypothetical protein
MTSVSAKLTFNDPGYIGLPYWPERDLRINISKEVHPKLGPAKKEAALAAACEKHGITRERYDEISKLADRPFYTLDGTRNGEIVIPQRIIQSFLNNANQEAPKAIPRIASKGLTFIGIKLEGGYLRTGRYERDAKLFQRFVKMENSNQRIFSSAPYISDFAATGTFLVDEGIINVGDLRKLIEYGGRWFGIGSARPQGFGRFQVIEWNAA